MTVTLEITKSSPPGIPTTLFQPTTSFTQKLLQIVVSLDPNSGGINPLASFAGTFGANAITLSGHRASARITYPGAGISSAFIRVWGMDQSLMNQLASLGAVFNSIQRNNVIVSAGDAVSGLTPVYGGVAWQAYGEYNNMPDVPFVFVCQTAMAEAVIAAQPTSFNGVTDVATLMSGFARLMGKKFENNLSGVKIPLSNPYYGGNVWTQVRRAAEDAGVHAEIVDGGSTLAIWPEGGSRNPGNAPVPLISPETGMIGYPTFSPNGYLEVRHIFNPLVSFGGQIQVLSSIPQANKTWTVQRLDLALDTLVPKGEWMGVAYCQPQSFSTPTPQGETAPS